MSRHAEIMREIDRLLHEHERVTRRMAYHLAARRYRKVEKRVDELLAEAKALPPDANDDWLEDEDWL